MEGEFEQYFPCPTPGGEPDCPYYKREKSCHEIKAHLFYPESDYKTLAEKVFRNLPENLETRCRRFEEASHAVETPPDKPPREAMIEAIIATRGFISVSKKKRLGLQG